jgi:AraC-like DNA-binding protein
MHPDSEPDTQSEEGGPPILILDPDSRIAEALALALRRRTQVERVTSGMAALLVAGKREVGLVLARGHLPDISPDDFLRLLRLLRPGIRVALLGTEAPSQGFLEAKPDVYFPEPIQLKYLLAWIADCLDQPSSSAPGVASPPVQYEIPPQHLEIIRWVLEFIERCYQEGTPLSKIAESAGVSRSHLCRLFKRVTGLSLKRFLTRRRLQAAKELILEPGATIDQVARRVGYRDAGHFDRVFRQWEGRTPSGYRRQIILRAFQNGVAATSINQDSSYPPSHL